MKKIGVALLFVYVVLGVSSAVLAADKPAATPQVMALNEIKAGMHGVAYTVFEGTTPEPLDVEILGVLHNANGPKGDMILARLHGKKIEYTGVVAGMSGSPVYIDGKLVGAIGFRIGEFSKEPIAGITPIQQMLEINELDSTVPAGTTSEAASASSSVTKTSGPGLPQAPAGVQNFANYMKPIDTPLVFNGFTEDAVRRFGPQFSAAGLMPVMGAGSSSDEKQPEPLQPGSAVSAVLVRGDMNIAATCTVTYIDPQRMLACGHPILQFGKVEIPMTKARVLATLASPSNSFKIVNTTEEIGSIVQDRHTGIMGRFGQEPHMIPVTLNVRGGSHSKALHYEVLNNGKLTPVAMMTTVLSALQGLNEYGEDVTYRLQGHIDVNGYPTVSLQNMFAPIDGGQPTGMAVALSLGDRFNRIYQNPYATPDVRGVTLDFDVIRDRRWARLDTVRTDVTEARPGDDIVVEAVVRPYRGERIVRQIPVRIPTSTPKGTLRILVSDGDTLDRFRRFPATMGKRLDLASTIALLNKEHANDKLYVSLLEANPEAMVDDKVMPTLPISMINAMEDMRGTQDMVLVGESAVNEASTPLDYAVSGAQVITVTVK